MLDFIKGDSMQITSSYGYTYTPTVNKMANTNQVSKTEEETQNDNTSKAFKPLGSDFYDNFMDDKARAVYDKMAKDGNAPSLTVMELFAAARYENLKNVKSPDGKLNVDNIFKIRESGEYVNMDFPDFLKTLSDSEKLVPNNSGVFQEFYSLYTDESYSPLDLKA